MRHGIPTGRATAAASLVLAGKAGVKASALDPVFADLMTADRLLVAPSKELRFPALPPK